MHGEASAALGLRGYCLCSLAVVAAGGAAPLVYWLLIGLSDWLPAMGVLLPVLYSLHSICSVQMRVQRMLALWCCHASHALCKT
jgi:hypothetical protein